MSIYTDEQRHLQDRFGTRRLADALEQVIVHDVLTDDDRAFIESRDMLFLSTVDASGQPTVSYKGGNPGFVRVEAEEIVLPSYDGNGMYLSMGNVDADARVGLLFIDFERPRRLRVHGTARLMDAGTAKAPGAEMIMRIKPYRIFVNCPRYIHSYQKTDTSRYVPDAQGQAPVAEWKRIDLLQDELPERDRRDVEKAGTITMEEYEDAVEKKRG